MSIVHERIKERRIATGKTLLQVANCLGVKEATAQRYESGAIKTIKYETIVALADFFHCDPSYLMGWENDPAPADPSISPGFAPLPSNMEPLGGMRQIPLIGQIACGTPILAEQNIEDYVDLPRHIRADYALTCKGNSMIGAGIHDGDVVYIRKQEIVNNGQIAAVLVGEDEATLKRFYYDGTAVTLIAENPTVSPQVFVGEDINKQRVLGLAVAFTHPIE